MKNVSKLFALLCIIGSVFFTSCQEEELLAPQIENQTGDPDEENPIGPPPPPPTND